MKYLKYGKENNDTNTNGDLILCDKMEKSIIESIFGFKTFQFSNSCK